MTCDSLGRPICRLCLRPVTRVFRADNGQSFFRADNGQSFVLACEACGAEESVPIGQLRSEQPRRAV